MDLREIYKPFYPIATEHTFLSLAPKVFSKLDHILVQKPSLSKFKKTEITVCILDYKGMKLEINRKNNKTFTKTWKNQPL